MIRANNPLVPLAVACSILAATATAQDSSGPLLPDKCTTKARSIFLGNSKHDAAMRKGFVDRCHVREREKGLSATGQAAEQVGSPSSGKTTGRPANR